MDEAGLAAALERFGVSFGLRRIAPGDEAAFDLTAALPERRRASGAARIVARQWLAEIGSDAGAPGPWVLEERAAAGGEEVNTSAVERAGSLLLVLSAAAVDAAERSCSATEARLG